MAKTAVGLFENRSSVDDVVRALKADRFGAKDVRVLSEPVDMGGGGAMSTPHTDFEVDLTRDLRAIGATEAHVKAYVEGVRRGGIMVFATGPGDKADAAVAIMNSHGAVEVDEVSGSDLQLPGAEQNAAPDLEASVLAGRTRSRGKGARLFVW